MVHSLTSSAPEKYGRHPSKELNWLFDELDFPHQGQDPNTASILFIGLDANYSSDLFSAAGFFPYILEYQRDGICFWMKYKTHHPFLLEQYPLKRNTGGVPYHKNFAKMRLDSSFADKISFVELIPYPTTGRTEESAFWKLFDTGHASKIDSLVCEGKRRLIILSSSVMRKMKKASRRHGVFLWLPDSFKLGEMRSINETTIFGAPHFSSAVTNEAIIHLGEHIREFCRNAP
jgi:hypothetical protein